MRKHWGLPSVWFLRASNWTPFGCRPDCPKRVQKCRELIQSMLRRTSTNLRNLQSLIGLLNFSCKVVIPARAFLRHLINLTAGVSRPFYHISLNQSAKADLQAWECFLQNFNGRALFLPDQWETSRAVRLFTNASGLGYGALFQKAWFYGICPSEWSGQNIMLLEFLPVVTPSQLWGPRLSNKRILFFTDNMALVHIINKCSSWDGKIMILVRRLVITAMWHNILFKAKHFAGSQNKLADSLSHLQLQAFRDALPWTDASPTVLPEKCRPENICLGS